MTLIAFKYRLKPNTGQQAQFATHIGHNRFIWNWALGLKQRYYRRYNKNINKRRLQDQLVKKKKQSTYLWLNEANSQSLLFTLLQLDNAYQRFFKQQASYPRFKSKHRCKQSFSCPQHVEIDFDKGCVKLPKIGWVKAVLHRQFEGKIKTVTISHLPSGKYQVSLLVETIQSLPVKSIVEADKSLGVDLGVKSFLVASDGTHIYNPKFLDQAEKELSRQQRILARKKKGSCNRAKQVRRVALLHEKAKNKRHDFLHQISTILADKSHATSIVIEDLAVKNMVKNKMLAKAIANVAWGMFSRLLHYKCERSGKNLIKVNRFYPSSKTCSCCGAIKRNLMLSERVYTCGHCHLTIDRDLNAAININRQGLIDHNELEPAGTVGTVKCSPNAMPVQVGALAKGYIKRYIGSVEAHTITACAV